ncbi:unknown [Coraliomargarita sp. CAG:312]|nr:unknown [Coraliomargarita sp. CAG:312]
MSPRCEWLWNQSKNFPFFALYSLGHARGVFNGRPSGYLTKSGSDHVFPPSRLYEHAGCPRVVL